VVEGYDERSASPPSNGLFATDRAESSAALIGDECAAKGGTARRAIDDHERPFDEFGAHG